MRSTIAVLVIVLTSTPAFAVPARDLTLNELVKGSNLIAVGIVERSVGEWQEGRILTRHEFRLEDVWFGKANGSIELTTLGGFVGDIGQRVSGQVSLKEKQRVVTFLRWDSLSDSYRFQGGTNGVYRVEAANDGTLTVLGNTVAVPEASLPTLEELERRVQEIARER